MEANWSAVKRWMPVEDIPDVMHPAIKIVAVPGGGPLLRIRYAEFHGDRDLLIHFQAPAATQIYEEFADGIWGPGASARWCDWPFMIVSPSDWIASFKHHTLSGPLEGYVHYVVGNIDGTAHIMADIEPETCWLGADERSGLE